MQLSRNNGNYDLLIKISRLVHSALMPHEHGSGSKFTDPLKDEKLMFSVFEHFVRNFRKAEQRVFSVKSKSIQWEARSLTAESAKYLPTMRTDITLRSDRRTIVIDAKYYSEALIKITLDRRKSDRITFISCMHT